MRKLLGMCFWMLVGGGLMFVAFNYHVIRAEEGIVPIPKAEISLTDFYVDVREWDSNTWKEHDALIRALKENGRDDLVKYPATPAGFLNDWLRLRQNRGAEKPNTGISRE